MKVTMAFTVSVARELEVEVLGNITPEWLEEHWLELVDSQHPNWENEEGLFTELRLNLMMLPNEIWEPSW
jgi:hypothetical protein